MPSPLNTCCTTLYFQHSSPLEYALCARRQFNSTCLVPLYWMMATVTAIATLCREHQQRHHQRYQESQQLAPQRYQCVYYYYFFSTWWSDCSSFAISSVCVLIWNAHIKILDKNCECNCVCECMYMCTIPARILCGESSVVHLFFNGGTLYFSAYFLGIFALCWYYKTILYIPFCLGTFFSKVDVLDIDTIQFDLKQM